MLFFIAAGLAETIAAETPNPTDVPEAATSIIQDFGTRILESLTSPQAVGALIGVVSALLVLLLGNRQKNKELFKNIQQKNKELFSHTVSHGRMEWVKRVRELCMELCAICEVYSADTILSAPDQLLAFYKERSGLLMHLSPYNTYTTDNELIELLNPLDKNPKENGKLQINPLSGNQEEIKMDFRQVQKNCPRIRAILTDIGKLEWDKVIIESGNNEEKKKKIEDMQKSRKIVIENVPEEPAQPKNEKDV